MISFKSTCGHPLEQVVAVLPASFKPEHKAYKDLKRFS